MSDGIERPVRWRDFVAWEPPPQTPILGKGVLMIGGKAVMFGRSKAYKTMTGLRLATSAALGTEWIGLETPRDGINVLYVNSEMPAGLFHERVAEIAKQTDADPPLYLYNRMDLKLDTPSGSSALATAVSDTGAELVVLDPLYKLVSEDLREEATIRRVVDNIDMLLASFHTSVFLIAHPRKQSGDVDLAAEESLYGSGMLLWWADSLLRLERRDRTSSEIVMNYEFVRHAKEDLEPARYYFDLKTLDFYKVQGVSINGTGPKPTKYRTTKGQVPDSAEEV